MTDEQIRWLFETTDNIKETIDWLVLYQDEYDRDELVEWYAATQIGVEVWL